MITLRRGSLDTNIILRLILQDNIQHYNLAKKLVFKQGVRFFVSDVVLFECVYAFETYYDFSRIQIEEVIKSFLMQKNIDCNRELTLDALTRYVKHTSLSYADCYLAASAAFMNAAPLWTFDKALAQKVPDAKLLR